MDSKVFYRNFRKNYPLAERADGIYIYANNKRYIDGSSGAVAANIGHGVKEVIEAINSQLQKVAFAHTARFTNEWQEKLALLLSEIAPNRGLSYFVSSGTDANETAIKLARQYHVENKEKKWKIISRKVSFHGNTICSLSTSGDESNRKFYSPLLLPFPQIEPCYCCRCPFNKTKETCSYECAFALEHEIKKQGAETVSAFIAEPIVGAAGAALVPHKDYFKIIREICDKYNVLLITDEVMTGFGRTGSMFAMQHFNAIADIITLGKGLTSGYSPLAACVASEKIAEAIAKGSGSFVHGTTYTGNPVSCAAGYAVVNYILKHRLHENAERIGSYIMKSLDGLKKNYEFIGDVRGKGLLIGVEFVNDKKSRGASEGIAKKVIETCMENGLLLYEGGRASNADCLLIAPPLITTKNQADEILEIFESSLPESL